MLRTDPVLEGERVILRLATPRDLRSIITFYKENADHLARHEPAKPEAFYSPRFWMREIPRRGDEYNRGRGCRMFIFDRDGKLTGTPRRVLGAVALTSIVRGALHGAYLGYSVAADLEGRGLVSEAVRMLVTFAFGELNLHRIMATYHPDNVRSARVLDRLGFVIEGRATQYLYIAGTWQDHVLTGLVNPHWKAPSGLKKDRTLPAC